MRLPSPLLLLLVSCGGNDGGKAFNTDPEAVILGPESRAVYSVGEPVELRGQVSDLQEDATTLRVSWRSDADGGLVEDLVPDASGEVVYTVATLSPGAQTLRLVVTDSEGRESQAAVTIGIYDPAANPTVTFLQPDGSVRGMEWEVFPFAVQVSDAADAYGMLRVVLSSDIDGVFCNPTPDASGVASCDEALTRGGHTLTATVTDSDGNTGVDYQYFEVIGEMTGDDADGDGWTVEEGDCDDEDPTVSPGGLEVCDTVDNDCDAHIDEGTECADDDLDGYTEMDGDCDDYDDAVYPGAVEVGDGVDNDCDGVIDEGAEGYDDDGDCYCDGERCSGSVNADCAELNQGDCNDGDAEVSPLAVERCDGVDNDCDGSVDEPDAVDTTVFFADVDGDGYGDPAHTASGCTPPVGYVDDATDCDDTSRIVFPGASELCDGVDNNCDGDIDEADAIDAIVWYPDLDGDGWGDPVGGVLSCAPLAGYAERAEDCDDADALVYPGADEWCDGFDNDCDDAVDEADAGDAATWYRDVDADGHGDVGSATNACVAPEGYVGAADDCDDGDATVFPGAAERCDGVDQDCDGSIDEGATHPWYRDGDGDGHGDPTAVVDACAAPSGYVAAADDCDDHDATVSPSGTERCDGVDDDCDGVVDEAGATDALTWHTDRDGDGFGDPVATTTACVAPSGYVADAQDCDDDTPAVNPHAIETCDGRDEDCDGLVDEAGASGETLWYLDEDGDGHGTVRTMTTGCAAPPGYVALADDCDDTNPAINPVELELCDGLDNDCDGVVDDGVRGTFYRDADGDGYGNASLPTVSCGAPAGYVADGTDCNDASASANPGASERCDGVDNDCDATVDEPDADGCATWYYDADGDGYGSSTSACLCAPSGAYAADKDGDCYDANATASPAATGWFDEDRGDASYDYNCDGVETQVYTTTYACSVPWYNGWACESYTSGFSSGVPACGTIGTWGSGCSASWYTCAASTSASVTQYCQ